MGGVGMRVRAELKARRRGLLALALMIGGFGTVAVASAAGARRTDSSVSRFLEEARAAQIEVGNDLDAQTQAAVARLPGIETYAPYTFFLMVPDSVVSGSTSHQLLGASIAGLSFGAPVDQRWLQTVDRPRVVEGRLPDPARADEIVLNESLSRKYKVGVGDTFTFHAYSMEQIFTVVFGGKNEPPAGPRYAGNVVGIVRHPIDMSSAIGGGFESAYSTPAFYARYRDSAANFRVNFSVRLRDGARGIPAFVRAVEQLAQKQGPDSELFAQSRLPQYAPAGDAVRVQAIALAMFAGLMALATVLVIGQSLARGIHSAAADHPALRALGMSRRDLFVAGLWPAASAIIAGIVLSAVGAAFASRLFPLGFARRAEPHAGFDFDATAIVGGAALLLLLLLARCAIAAWRAAPVREVPLDAKPSVLGEAITKAGLPASVMIGTRMALAPSRGRGSISVRSATVGAVIALAAMSTGIGIASSIHHLVQTPALYGANWDVAMNSGDDPGQIPRLTERLNDDPQIGDFSSAMLADVVVGGKRTQSYGVEPIRGSVFFSIIDGRRPRGTGEIALGTETMRRLHVSLGGSIQVKSPATSASMKVVGRIVLPGMDDDTLGDGAAMDVKAFRALKLDESIDFPIFVARFRPGVDRIAAVAALRKEFGPTNVTDRQIPPVVQNLTKVQDLPPQLADLLLALAVATVAHTVVTSVRERRREIAIFKTLGFVRRQAAAVVSAQSTTFMIVALLFGVPLGYAAANWTWTALADRAGFVPAPAIEAGALVIYAIGVLVVANVVAAWPGRTAARSRPSLVLRAE
jgi:putative ABC transport system permease protein